MSERTELELGDLVTLEETTYDYQARKECKRAYLGILVRWVDEHHEVGIFLVGSSAEDYWTANVACVWKVEDLT